MLGKLFKYEFKDTGKVLLPLNLALIGLTILGSIIIGLGAFESDNFAVGMLLVSMILFYGFGIIALYIVSYIYLMIRFYRSMYSAEGYLTHTLPTSTFSILNTKIIVSVFWVLVTMLLTIFSVIALILSGAASTGTLANFSWVEFSEIMESLFGMSIGKLAAWVFVFTLLSSCSGILMIYCSISIGQLFNKYKVLAAIVTYIIIYIILQIVNAIISITRTYQMLIVTDPYHYEYSSSPTFMDLMGGTFGATMIQSTILIIIYYVTCAIISSKKLNLD